VRQKVQNLEYFHERKFLILLRYINKIEHKSITSLGKLREIKDQIF